MAWAGSGADLRPVLDAMERQLADMRRAYIEEKTAFYRGEVERTRNDLNRAEDSLAQVREGDDVASDRWGGRAQMYQQAYDKAVVRLNEMETEAEAFDEITVEVRSKRGGSIRRTRGRPADVVDYLAHLEVKELELNAPAARGTGSQVSVRFDQYGVHITASSTESRWTSAAISQVTEAVRRRVPWWRWARSLWFLVPLLAVTSVYVVYTALAAVPEGTIDQSVLSILFVVGAWVLTPIAVLAASRALPPFELTATERPTGTRVFYVLGTALVAFLVGLIVNSVS